MSALAAADSLLRRKTGKLLRARCLTAAYILAMDTESKACWCGVPLPRQLLYLSLPLYVMVQFSNEPISKPHFQGGSG